MMHVWLASYPRSGNSLMGMLLAQSFGIIREVRNKTLVRNDHEYELAGSHLRSDIVVKKTHDAPEDNAPAICIVRDGRSAVVSYRHYHRDVHDMDIPLRELIAAETGHHLHWTAHFRAWDPMNRPNTLFLRYEKVVADRAGAVRAVADLLGIRPVTPFEAGFEVGRRAEPRIFRKGDDDANIAELRGNDLALFDELHGPLMRELGYYRPVP